MFDANEIDDSWLNRSELETVRAPSVSTIPAPIHLPVTLWMESRGIGNDVEGDRMGFEEYMDWVREQNEKLFNVCDL